MFQKFKIALASIFSVGISVQADGIAPVDLNKPVENPALVSAMERVAKENSNEAKDLLVHELKRANFIAAMLADKLIKKEGSKPGLISIEKGSQFGLLCAKKDGKNYLLLFTDWNAIKAYTDLNVTAMVLPAKDAWSFALEGNTYQGIVINPAHNAVPLERPMLEFFNQESK